MPKRFCQCASCPFCRTQAGTHGVLYDADLTGTLKCPGCQQQADAARNARTPTAARGYGAAHQAVRARLLAQWQAGDPCAICGKPMLRRDGLDLAHNEDRSGYKGLAHAACNRATNTGKVNGDSY